MLVPTTGTTFSLSYEINAMMLRPVVTLIGWTWPGNETAGPGTEDSVLNLLANGLIWRGLHRATGIKRRDGHMERETDFGHMVAEGSTQEDLQGIK